MTSQDFGDPLGHRDPQEKSVRPQRKGMGVLPGGPGGVESLHAALLPVLGAEVGCPLPCD